MFSYLLTWSVCYLFSEELLFLLAKPFLLVTTHLVKPRLHLGDHLGEPRLFCSNHLPMVDCSLRDHLGEPRLFCSDHLPMVDCIQESQSFISTHLMESFNTYITASFIGAFFFCTPFLVYQLWCFLIPSSFQSRRKYYSKYCRISLLSFLVFLWLNSVFILPTLWLFLIECNATSTSAFVIELQPRIYDFILLTCRFLCVGAFCSQIPIFIFYLIEAQMIELNKCIQHRKLVWLTCLLLGAFITPPECQLITTFCLGVIIEITFVFAYVQYEYKRFLR